MFQDSAWRTRLLKLFLDSSCLVYLRYALRDDVADFVTGLLKRSVEKNISLLVNMIVLDEAIWILKKKCRIQLGEILELTDRLASYFAKFLKEYPLTTSS